VVEVDRRRRFTLHIDLLRSLIDRLPLRIGQGRFDDVEISRFLNFHAEQFHIDREEAVPVEGIEISPGPKIADARLRGAVQKDIALDTADAPEILAFEIGAVRPAIDLEGDRVFAGPEVFGDIPFRRGLGILAVARHLPVDPDIKGRLDRAEMNKDLAAGPGLRNGKSAQVGTDRIEIVRHLRRFGIRSPLIGDVDIDGLAVALQLPVGGDLDLFPAAGIETGFVKIEGAVGGFADPVEFPWTIQALHPGRVHAVVGDSGGRIGEGCAGDVRCLLVDAEYRRIFPIQQL